MNNKYMNNNVGKEKIVDKSKDFPTIATNNFCLNGFEESKQEIFHRPRKANNSNQVKKDHANTFSHISNVLSKHSGDPHQKHNLTQKQTEDLKLLKEEMKKETLYQSSEPAIQDKQEERQQEAIDDKKDAKHTYDLSNKQIQIVKKACSYLNEKNETTKTIKSILKKQLGFYLKQKNSINKQKHTSEKDLTVKEYYLSLYKTLQRACGGFKKRFSRNDRKKQKWY